jgi:sugar phosphate isomerase/epimerase
MSDPQFPRLYLALDNCFASKRWTAPLEWMQIARECDIHCLEASADTECDPLYTPPDALADWRDAVLSATQATGVKVANLYSGHGTYATLGLAHPDKRVRDHIQHRWLEPMIDLARSLEAGLGFFCHAFPQATLADPAKYAAAVNDLTRRLGELAGYAESEGLSSLSVEQMYTPHQIPWTIAGAEQIMREAFRQAGAPLYITLDSGHQVGQGHFQDSRFQHRGTETTEKSQSADSSIQTVQPYMIAEPEDGDLYAWLRRLGGYSPIIHLQQTDGTESKHKPFTAANNAKGIVEPRRVLQALYEAYSSPAPEGLPPRCESIYLTLELFSGTLDKPDYILKIIRESAAYWRQFIPQDGVGLDTLVG